MGTTKLKSGTYFTGAAVGKDMGWEKTQVEKNDTPTISFYYHRVKKRHFKFRWVHSEKRRVQNDVLSLSPFEKETLFVSDKSDEQLGSKRHTTIISSHCGIFDHCFSYSNGNFLQLSNFPETGTKVNLNVGKQTIGFE